jgi:rhodanese-related sulfurtransferase
MQNRLATLLAIALMGTAAVAPSAFAGDPASAASAEAVSQTELLARLERKDPDLVVLDVRTPAEFAAGHVPGARNVSHDLLASRLTELAPLRDKQVVLYCRSGRRTLLAADVLHAAGFTHLAHLEGDYLAWEAEHRPIER